MQISLHSRLRKLLFVVAVMAVVGPFLFFSTQSYRAYRLSERGDLTSAIRLEPGNAEYRRQLGQLQLFTETDPRLSVDNLKMSTTLNPFSAPSWLALAGAYRVSGDTAKEKESIKQAVRADPSTPQIAWEAAVFFAARGETDTALRYFRGVSQYDDDPSLALEAAWRLTQNADQVLGSAMPDTVAAHIAFLRLMVAKKEPAGAQKTWNHLMEMGKAFDPKTVFFYLQYLLERQDGTGVRNAWRELATLSPTLNNYNAPNNLIVNPGFEEEMLNGGLDWQFKPASGTELAVDTSVFHSGARSLSIGYGGESNSDAGVLQFVPVEPLTHYQLGAYTKGDQLSSANGPYLSITDAKTNQQLGRSDECISSFPWKPTSVDFQTGQNTTIILLTVGRNPGSTHIRGKLWLDDMSLVVQK